MNTENVTENYRAVRDSMRAKARETLAKTLDHDGREINPADLSRFEGTEILNTDTVTD